MDKRMDLGSSLAGVIVGALIGYFGNWLHDRRRRVSERDDVARALYAEISQHATRCWYDFMDPWQKYFTRESGGYPMTAQRVSKFRPAPATMYSTLGSRLALLDASAIPPVLHFYFQLDAWRRDIDHWSNYPGDRELSYSEFNQLARRIGQTLQPAFNALAALERRVMDWKEIERESIATYTQGTRDELRPNLQSAIQTFDSRQRGR